MYSIYYYHTGGTQVLYKSQEQIQLIYFYNVSLKCLVIPPACLLGLLWACYAQRPVGGSTY